MLRGKNRSPVHVISTFTGLEEAIAVGLDSDDKMKLARFVGRLFTLSRLRPS